MSNFPDWTGKWLSRQGTQVSHGLNLVLELETPEKLPLMLWDIVVSQDQIKRALEDLSFVHYARFIPAWDGLALMVTTEFDGPLDPYVLDFVIALGDVFDKLVSYVKEKPPTPVREHPVEFLKWVREWNKVPFYRRIGFFPEAYDYPLYSAYPDKTVTDIAGPHRYLPPPALDHPVAAIGRPIVTVDLADVQGNILRGYAPRHGRYLLFSVANPDSARQWLAKELPAAGKPWGGVGSAALWSSAPPAVLTQVAFTHAGMTKLLPDQAHDLATFPQAFKDGAAARAEDNFDRGASKPDQWLFGHANDPVHVVLFVYTKQDSAPAAFDAAVQALKTQAQGLTLLHTYSGEYNGGAEPFGFADGISDPTVNGLCPVPRPALAPPLEPDAQPAASPGEFLLHQDYASIYGGNSLGNMPQGLAGNGSFGVLRLMEQDVAGFNTSTDSEAARLGVKPELLRAKLVGRETDGTPLAQRLDLQATSGATNAFDYAPSWEFPKLDNDHEGKRCPVAAHIRRANPRSARVAGQPHSRRLLRRGMASRWQEGGKDKVGLMGLFMGANLEQQFEFIQRQWLHGNLAASGIRGTTDAISAIRAEDTDFPFLVPNPVCDKAPPLRLIARIPPLVRTRGSLYLFFPGLKALKALDAAATPLAPPANAVAATVTVAVQTAQAAADSIADATSEAVSETTQVFSDILGGISDVTGGAVGGVKATITEAAKIVPVVQSQLPGVSAALEAVPDLDALLDVPELQHLADGNWRKIITDLIDRNLDSDLFQNFVKTYSPVEPPVDVQPPAGVPVADLDLADPNQRAFLFDKLRQLREADKHRIVWVPAQQACWVLQYDDCKELLWRHADFLQTQKDTKLRGIVTLDQPRHTDVSDAYKAAFATALANVQPKIGPIVTQVVDGLRDQTDLHQFDYMQGLRPPGGAQCGVAVDRHR